MGLGCLHCLEGIAHCHGAVIHHLNQRPECTEDGCTTPESVPHTFAVDCDAVGCRCSPALPAARSARHSAHRVG